MTTACVQCSQLYFDNFKATLDTKSKSLLYKINKGLRSAESAWIPLFIGLLGHLNSAKCNDPCGACSALHYNKDKMLRSAGIIFILELLVLYKTLTTQNMLFSDARFSAVIRNKIKLFDTTEIPLSTLWKGSEYYHQAFFGN